MKFTEEELEKLKKEKMEEIDRWLDNEYGCSYTRLEELHNFLIDRNMKFQDELERYKNIIDKAVEYINENKHLSMFADCREPEEDWNYDLEINPRDLLNILKGSDE